MQNTVILVTTHRGISDETWESIFRLKTEAVFRHKGDACIDKARSVSFDMMYSFLEKNTTPKLETILCIDDDIVFDKKDAMLLVKISRAYKQPISARYLSQSRSETHRTLPNGKWLTGLGFMAIPVSLFLEIGKRLPTLGGIRLWCKTGEIPELPGEWSREDYYFCSHFGGVLLADNIKVGHLKSAIIREES